MSDSVKLKFALVWDCPKCGYINKVNTNHDTREMTDEELETVGADSGTAMLAPEEVTCSSCLTSWDVDFSDMECI